MKRIIFAAILLAILTSFVRADSLYSADSFFTTMFSDRKAAQVGDVLHILITESASATQSAGRTHNKEADASASPGIGWLKLIKFVGYGSKSKYTANNTAVRSGTITARLTVTIKEVLSNGNLLIEGRRYVKVNKDVQEITLQGEVRPRDIRRDNTVFSYQVANVEIEYSGSDPGRPGRKVGIIQRIINFLF